MPRLARKLVVLAALVCAASSFAAGHTIQDALTALKAEGTPGPRWTFVVIGDTRHFLPVVQSPGFIKALPEINTLHPDLAIDIGDLILGYSKDDALINREWDAYFKLIERATEPFFSVVGNHDVSTPEHKKIFTRRVGPMYYSFTYGPALFLCLATEEPGYIGKIGPTQLAWIRNQLSANKTARMLFVFMHEPLWAQDPKGWEPVHQLLKAYPAVTKDVFAGHWHVYTEYPERDGVRYTITGGGGAEIGDQPRKGDFHHFLFVQVKGDHASWSVIHTGGIDPPNIVTSQQAATVSALSSCLGALEAQGQQGTSPATAKLKLRLRDTTKSPLRLTLAWQGLAYCDSIDPFDFGAQLDPGQDKTFEFSLKARNPAMALRSLKCLITIPLPGEKGKTMTAVRVPKFSMAPGVHLPEQPAAPAPEKESPAEP